MNLQMTKASKLMTLQMTKVKTNINFQMTRINKNVTKVNVNNACLIGVFSFVFFSWMLFAVAAAAVTDVCLSKSILAIKLWSVIPLWDLN